MSNALPMVVAVHRINGKILPGTLFTPSSKADLDYLQSAGAVREPTEAELALAEKMAANAAAGDTPKKARGGRRAAAAAEAETADAGEAAGEDADTTDSVIG